MKNLKLNWILIILIIFCNFVYGIYIKESDYSTFVQPNHSYQFQAKWLQCGFIVWAETDEGYSIVNDNEGSWTYADKDAQGNLIATEYKVGWSNPKQLEIEEFLQPDETILEQSAQEYEEMQDEFVAEPVYGDMSVGVILIEFADADYNFDALGGFKDFIAGGDTSWYSNTDFDSIFFSTDYYYQSPEGTETYGSVNDYYKEVSYNQYWLSGRILNSIDIGTGRYKWLRADSIKGYYNSQNGLDPLFVDEAYLKAKAAHNADPGNFADPDDFERLIVVYAGILGGGMLHPFVLNTGLKGNKITRYPTQQSDDVFMKIGTICHEFAHTLGLPDKYPRYNDVNISFWGLMADAYTVKSCPTHMISSSKLSLGWIYPDTLRNNTNVILHPYENNPYTAAKIIPIESSREEYFIIENRREKGFDKSLPGFPLAGTTEQDDGGVLIWHVIDGRDYLEYDHSLLLHSPKNDFPQPGRTIFYPFSIPSSDGYEPGPDGEKILASGVSLENISESSIDSTVTFDVQLNKWAGKINYKKSWKDTINIVGDIEINTRPLAGQPTKFSERSLNIYPKTKIMISPSDGKNLGNNATKVEFIVNGYVEAMGKPDSLIEFISAAASPSAGDWEGIISQGSAYFDDVSFLSNTIVKHAINGIVFDGENVAVVIDSSSTSDCSGYGLKAINQSQPTISNSSIFNCTLDGFRIDESWPTVDNNEITTNRHGLYMYYTNNAQNQPLVTNNNIHDNSHTGIYLYESSPAIRDNDIGKQSYGLNCRNNSSPYLGDGHFEGNNNIYDNDSYGIYAWINSSPFLGDENWEVGGGDNVFTGNRYNVYANNHCGIMAENNYWGSNPPDADLFRMYNSSWIDYTPWLPFAPAKTGGIKNLAVKNGPAKDDTEIYDPRWSIRNKIRFARALVRKNQTQPALRICRNIVSSYPDSLATIQALDVLYEISRRDNLTTSFFTTWLDSLGQDATAAPVNGFAALLSFGFDRDTRISRLDNLISRAGNSEIAEFALFQKFMYYLNDKNDLQAASEISVLLDIRFPESESALEAHMLLGDVIWKTNAGLAKHDVTGTELPEQSELEGIFPNPFNPSTSIRYALPRMVQVSVSIYNTLGQRVKTLEIPQQAAGRHELIWDGKDDNGRALPSGMYVYRFEAKPVAEDSKNFSTEGKMLLIR